MVRLARLVLPLLRLAPRLRLAQLAAGELVTLGLVVLGAGAACSASGWAGLAAVGAPAGVR